MKARLTFKYVIPDSCGRIARQIFTSVEVEIPEELKIYENGKSKFINTKECDLFSCEYIDLSTKCE